MENVAPLSQASDSILVNAACPAKARHAAPSRRCRYARFISVSIRHALRICLPFPPCSRPFDKVASCGDDSNVRVSDLRSSSSSGVSHRLDGVHEGSCHTARWHPRDANLLLTAGLDSTVKLFDLRQLASPLHVFRGHCPYALAR